MRDVRSESRIWTRGVCLLCARVCACVCCVLVCEYVLCRPVNLAFEGRRKSETQHCARSYCPCSLSLVEKHCCSLSFVTVNRPAASVLTHNTCTHETRENTEPETHKRTQKHSTRVTPAKIDEILSAKHTRSCLSKEFRRPKAQTHDSCSGLSV
jgi:hypothetical protein